MENNNSKIIDTMTRTGAISAQLIAHRNGTYTVRYQMGSKKSETESLSRDAAGELWERLNNVGMKNFR